MGEKAVPHLVMNSNKKIKTTCGKLQPKDAIYFASYDMQIVLMPTGSTSNNVLIGILKKENKPWFNVRDIFKSCN